MMDTKKMEYDKDLLKKTAGKKFAFPVLSMTQPSFTSMKPVVPFKFRVSA